MSAAVPALLLASGSVGLAHSVLPDHWLPLAVAARSRRDPLHRAARLSLFAGIAHVVVSVVLGAVVIAIGLSLRSVIESSTNLIVGGILIATGVAFLVLELTGRGHHHHHDDDHDHDHHHDNDHHHDDHVASAPKGLALLIPFGAAASPDLTILPVFLAAAGVSTAAALGSLAVFTVITVGTFVALTTLVAAGAYQLTHRWLDEHANKITGIVLIGIGTLIATNVL